MAMAVLAPVARVVVIARLVPVALLVAVALTACGGDSATVAKTTTTAHDKGHLKPVQPYVDIYAGLPLSGPMAPEGRAILKGIRLVFASLHHHRLGDLHINFKLLNDAGRKTGDKNLARTAANAGTVAIDPHAVYYIGDLGSAATTVSLPILSAAGIAQVTPGDPFILASDALASKLLRLLPPYTVQAAADVLFFKQIPPKIKDDPCTHILAFAQGDPESTALVAAMDTDAKTDGIEMPKPTPLIGKANSLTSPQAMALQHQFPLTCGLVIAGSESKPAVALTRTLHSIFHDAFIVGTSGLCSSNSRWTKAVVHAIPTIADSLLWCTSPLLPLGQYEHGADFVNLYKNAHGGSHPSPYAFYGYEAADLGIVVIHDLGADGNNRVAVRTNLSGSQTDVSVFGQFGLLLDGKSSTLTAYGVYRVSPTTAEPSYFITLKPPVP
jgi:branched-chain amino acid transport system substrate-binding protein